MGVSTNGQLCYGIVFPESFEFPWGENEEKWWRNLHGYKPPFELYTDDQDYIGGTKPPESKLDEYWDHYHDWKKANPFPVELVNYCSDGCHMYIIAVPESFERNYRGYPKKIESLTVTEEQKQNLIDFCKKYLQDRIDEYNAEKWNKDKIVEPAWYLSSYWG